MARLRDTVLFTDTALKGYWELDSNWNDSSASGYNLTPTNSPTFAAGRYYDAAYLQSASTQSASIADGSCPDLEISGSQTWVCWVNQVTISSYQSLMVKGSGATRHGIVSSADSGNVVYFTLSGLTTNAEIPSVTGLSTGAWYHIAGVYDSEAGKLRIYINGRLDNELTASGSSTDTNSSFKIGTGAGEFNGYIDEAAVFNRALTLAEIQLLAFDRPGIITGEI
jgi:hypothetical protein